MLRVDDPDTGMWAGVVVVDRFDVGVIVGVGAKCRGERLAVRMLDVVSVHIGGAHICRSVSWEL